MKQRGIEVKCRKCGRSASADSFVLDHVFKVMVCPSCVKDRKIKEQVHSEIKARKEEGMAASAKESEKHAVATTSPSQEKPSFIVQKTEEKIDLDALGSDKVKAACNKCGYKFTYNVVTKTPALCPYCRNPTEK
ncbi:MAG: hypothetical protein V1859_09240 [archaeon]